jgi:hypothetical protein
MSNVSRETGHTVNDETLVRYLIGAMTDEEADPLDELSVADAEFETRLRAVEYDLLDAYANGELTGETLDRFKAQYLSTPAGLAKVEIAGALRGYRASEAAGARGARASAAAPAAARATGWWMLAAAAAVLLLATGWLAAENFRLRREAGEAREHQATLEQRERQLQETVDRQQSAMTAASQELARVREALAAGQAAAARVLAFVLLPANRGGESPAIRIPANTDTVTLRLQLDGNDYARYNVTIKEENTGRIIWRGARLRATTAAAAAASAPRSRTILPASLPAHVLRPGAYAADVVGLADGRPPEPLDSYPFRVVLQ